MHSRLHRQQAFTLLEIMAVILIMGLLLSVVGVSVVGQLDKARVDTAQTQVKRLESMLDMYRADNSRYPTTEQGLKALIEKPTSAPEPRRYPPDGYLRHGLPLDPWDNPYQYKSPGDQNPRSFDLWSWGADGAPGGDDTDADIGNWSEGNDEL